MAAVGAVVEYQYVAVCQHSRLVLAIEHSGAVAPDDLVLVGIDYADGVQVPQAEEHVPRLEPGVFLSQRRGRQDLDRVGVGPVGGSIGRERAVGLPAHVGNGHRIAGQGAQRLHVIAEAELPQDLFVAVEHHNRVERISGRARFLVGRGPE